MYGYMLRKGLIRIPRTDGVEYQPVAEIGLGIIVRCGVSYAFFVQGAEGENIWDTVFVCLRI